MTLAYIIGVQARGQLKLIGDKELVETLHKLTRQHERGAGSAWEVSDAPQEYIDAMKDGIVGFEIELTSVEGSWKLSQNKEAPTREAVARQLDRQGKHRAADAVRCAL